MKKINIVFIFLVLFQFIGFAQTPFLIKNGVTNGQPNGIKIDCAKLKQALFIFKKVCLVKETPGLTEYIVFLDDCDLTLGLGEELYIPSTTNLKLTGTTKITLNNDAKITGEHFQTSRVTIGESNSTAINMEGCNNCAVNDITITAESTATNAIGIEIDAASSGNEVSEVKFQSIDNGMVVEGTDNTFNDLQFLNVARDEGDCLAETGDNAAIKLKTSNGNTFTNVLQTQSPGAITLYFEGTCSNNTILNLSVEEEASHCIDDGTIPVPFPNDPALFIDNLTSTNNIITCNFNHAKTTTLDDVIICASNNISDLGCMSNVIFNCGPNTN